MIMEYGIIASGDLNNVSGNFIKDFFSVAGWLLAVGTAIWGFTRKTRIEQPLAATIEGPVDTRKVVPLATVHDLNLLRADHDRRLTDHDRQIGELWKTMRDENESIRDEVRKGFQDMERSLGRIEGKLSKSDEL